MDIQNILKKSAQELDQAGSPTPEIDARVLLEFTLNKPHEYLMAHTYEPLTNSAYSKFRRLIRRRKKGEPIAYITKHKEFFSYDFYINKNVLVPRPESEMLVEIAMQLLELRIKNYELSKKLPNTEKPQLSILDIGTGSGNIIISLALETLKLRSSIPMPSFYASDISKKALYVARKNAKNHKVNKKIRFFLSDLFSNSKMPKKYDLIIANLPYVPILSKKLKVKSKKHWKIPISYEPTNAIFAHKNGTKIINNFLKQALTRINDDGMILIEADPRNIESISIYAKKLYKNSKIKIIADLEDKKRVLKVLT